ncbi:MAG: helix-turn-helix domain-containing protein [Lachnospiraceae bacterium]|jgi:DNA-binding XRE family transcriptional regulator
MIPAYDKIFLDDAMNSLGEALDYVSNACQMDVNIFMDMFIAGGYAKRFGEGESAVVSGVSGTELARKVMFECGLEIAFPDALTDYEGVSYEYCVGQLLAYMQWYTGRSFANILSHVELKEFIEPARDFALGFEGKRTQIADKLKLKFAEPVRLQRMRKRCGLSQKQLADAADVNIRTLQQYEIKSKDINKAAAVTVLELARVMGCSLVELMEYDDE